MTISLSNATVVAGGVDPPRTTVTAGYELRPDGTIYESVNGTDTKIGNWDSVANEGSSYECEFIFDSGTAPTFNSAPSYATISTTQSVSLTKGPGDFTSNLTVNLREKANHSNSATCSLTLRNLLSH